MGKPNPQNLKPWKPGQSGNPKGRPPMPEELRKMAQAYGPEALERLAHWMKSENPKASVTAADKLLSRGFGNPEQPVDISGGLNLNTSAMEIAKRFAERNK